MSTPQPFHIDIPQADLDDLAARLALTRWPDELPGAGWDYGVARDRVRQVAAYWRQGYDWQGRPPARAGTWPASPGPTRS